MAGYTQYASVVVVTKYRWDGQVCFELAAMSFSSNPPSIQVCNITANGATIDAPTDVRSIVCRAVKPHSWLSQVGSVVQGSEDCNCEKGSFETAADKYSLYFKYKEYLSAAVSKLLSV